jgi:hypothetical protein
MSFARLALPLASAILVLLGAAAGRLQAPAESLAGPVRLRGTFLIVVCAVVVQGMLVRSLEGPRHGKGSGHEGEGMFFFFLSKWPEIE